MGAEIVVYTANMGGYDVLQPALPFDGVEYVVYSDVEQTADGWRWVPTERLFAKIGKADSSVYKTRPHRWLPDADVWVWIDANVQLLVHPDRLLAFLSADGVAAFPHYLRECVYDEAVAVVAEGRADAGRVDDEMKWLRAVNYPENHGLAETGVLVRRNMAEVCNLNDYWWNCLMIFQSWRDQLAFNPSLWVQRMEWGRLPGGNVRSHPWFGYRAH